MSENPIYIEFYSHEACDCFKIEIPWTAYRKEIEVLCKVSDGYEKAKAQAKDLLNNRLNSVLESYPKYKEFKE